MSRRHFSILLVVSVVLAVAIALLLPRPAAREQVTGKTLLGDYGNRINEVDELLITVGGGNPVIHLDKGETAWTIRELQNYPADWGQLRNLLSRIAEAKITEPKTSNPELYSRLGVEDITVPGASGVLLELKFGNESLGIIVGHEPTSRSGHYVRLADNGQSVLIDQELDISTEVLGWADEQIADIGSSLVAEMRIRQPDGEQVVMRKISADDTDFMLDNLPEGRSQLSAWSVNSLANNFSMLRMDAVLPDPGEAAMDPVKIELLTFSGLRISVQAFELEERGWIRLVASAPDSETSVEDEANAINRKVNGWVYRLPESKFDAITKRMEQLLEPQDPGTGA